VGVGLFAVPSTPPQADRAEIVEPAIASEPARLMKCRRVICEFRRIVAVMLRKP
jgi:hypothetical protein